MTLIKSLIGFYFNFLSLVLPKLAGKQCFYFFCYPFKAKLKPQQQTFLDTADHKTIQVDNKGVRSYKWGNGPKKVLFVHGWQSNSYRWKSYIEKLDKTQYTILAFDAPGHGNSDGRFSNVPLYEKTLQAIFKEYGKPDSIVSHSIGAFAAMYHMHKNNTYVDRYVSLATPFTAVQFVHVLQSELKLSERAVRHMKDYFEIYAGNKPEAFSLERFAPAIKGKCLLIHDKGDDTTSYEHSVQLHDLLQDSELLLTEGLGHRLRDAGVVDKVVEWV